MGLNIPDNGKKRIVVIGGGFGGMTLVKKLAGTDYQVVLIDKNNYHRFQPLLYQVASAELSAEEISFPFRKIYRKYNNVIFRMAEFLSVDPSSKKISTDKGDLYYDYLVFALGSVPNFFGMKNVEKYALPMKSSADALDIRNHILENFEKASLAADPEVKRSLLNVIIVGGGATGVELAGAMAEMKANIKKGDYHDMLSEIELYLIEGSGALLGNMGDKVANKTAKLLRRKGVNVLLNSTVSDYVDGAVVLKTGKKIESSNLIWTSGVKVAEIVGIPQELVVKGGRITVDEFSAVKGMDNVFVIGDAAMQTDVKNPKGYPQLARVSIEQGQHLASNLKRVAEGKEFKPFKYREYPVLAVVGRNNAFFEYKNKYMLSGFIGWLAWVGVHIFLVLGVNNKWNILSGWAWNYFTNDHPARIIVTTTQKSDT
ncbi:MAG: NAD(P)/FAD-dependent oxidoreductase [Rikenellaceae bacterium]|nr:NAD(P)/FAD-dependent oxidoreductase [Rikenellaceae bacterium]